MSQQFLVASRLAEAMRHRPLRVLLEAPPPSIAVQHLATACPPLDALLDGGLEADAITLVFGEGGSGKTNLALQCAREAALAGKRVAYVDTEGVSGVRMRQVFEGALPPGASAAPGASAGQPGKPSTAGPHDATNAGAAGATDPVPPHEPSDPQPAAIPSTAQMQVGEETIPDDAARLLRELESRVLFITPYTIEEQERMVLNATKLPGLGLIVVDSINMHYRLHIDAGGDSESDAARSLYKQLHHLTGFARQSQVPILVTGQVYGGEDATQPFARRVMEHLVKALVRFEKKQDGSRKATVLKHRSIEEGRGARFRITQNGLA